MFEKGDQVVFTHLYAMAKPGTTGTVVKVYHPAGHQEQVRVDFGANLTGQRLRQTVPGDVLEKTHD